MKSLRELITSELGSVGSPWSWKKMSWTLTSVKRFRLQREMSLRPYTEKKLVMTKRIIVDSIKDHLIPQVSSLNTPKDMFDALTKLFEGKNINQKMALRNQMTQCKDPKCRDHQVLL